MPSDRRLSAEPHVGIVGAGPAGLVAARRLADAGAQVEIFEAGTDVGGLSRSLELWGRPVELAAHIFRSDDPFVASLWDDHAGDVTTLELRRAIFAGRSTIPYPLTPRRLARHLTPSELLVSALELGAGRLTATLRPEPPDAQSWMRRRYGRRLHDLLFRDYAEKLWGAPTSRIDAEFARFLFDSASSSMQGSQIVRHPRDGVGAVWQRLADRLLADGVALHLGRPVDAIVRHDDRVTGLVAAGAVHQVDHVISTLPVGHLARLLWPDDPTVTDLSGVLAARSTVLVYLRTPVRSRSGHNWVAIYPPEFRAGRLTDFGEWSGWSDGTTVQCMEFWCDAGDALWTMDDDDLSRLAADELGRTGLLGAFEVQDRHVERIRGSHPTYRIGASAAVGSLTARISRLQGCSSVGRHGSHAVLGMGESMEAARLTADRVLAAAATRR